MTALERQLLAGRYQIAREVGRGAAGVVYRALDVERNQTAALKVLSVSGSDYGEEANRFLREGELLSALAHKGVVGVLGYGTLDAPYADGTGLRFRAGTPYVAMEWLDGEDLAVRQRREPLSLVQVVEVGRQIAEALACAHEAGVVHRDIKPSNIFLTCPTGDLEPAPSSGVGTLRPHFDDETTMLSMPVMELGSATEATSPAVFTDARGKPCDVVAKLLDFGVAAVHDASFTGAGAIVGTPAYMSPEQAQGDGAADARSDLYSLGATLFELCVGRPPHAAATSIATLARRVTGPAPRLGQELLEVPDALDELVARLLEPDPKDRPRSARLVAVTLAEIARDPAVWAAGRLTLREDDSRARIGTRLITTLVALGVATGDARKSQLTRIRSLGADALPLGTDSIVVHLGARQAFGDEASRALEIGAELAVLGAKVGIATGRTRVDLTQSSGDIVDRAAKLAREASDGKVVHDSTTGELTRGRFEFEVQSLGESGLAAPRSRIRDDSDASSFIGREAELLTALGAFERCIDDRTPIVVSISGPPGIGKSRLGQEVIRRIERKAETPQVMIARCESYGRAQALGTASDLLRSLLMLPKGASIDAAREAVRAASHERSDTDESALLAHLLSNQPFPEGIEPRAARDAIYVAMTELVIASAARARCALVIEDAQWADPDSIAWVEHVLGRAQGQPLFALLLVRPAFWRNHPQRFHSRDHVRLELKPMARRVVRELARSLIGPAATDEQLDQVAEQAAGSPLFAEELARLVAQGKGLGAAATIEAAIQVSLDALDESGRDAVGRLAIFGLSTWEAGLMAIGGAASSPTSARPDIVLGKLASADLLVESAKTRFAGTREFIFKHALVRDVAYAMVGDALKKELHGRAAEWLEQMGEDAATIAHHFDLGGRHEDAARHWEAAARRALATNSLADAASMAERSLAFADDKPSGFSRAVLLEEAQSRLDARGSERDVAIQSMRENVFDRASELKTEGASARYDDARAQGSDIEGRLRSVRERARELGLVDEAARCSATLAQRLAFKGDLSAAETESRDLLDLVASEGIVWAAVDAWQALAIVRQTRGELAAALEARRSAARAARAAGLQEREAVLTMNLGFALTTIGAKAEALVELETGLAKAHSIGSLGAVRHGQMNLLGWASTFGADAHVDKALAEPRGQADEAAAGAYVIQDRATLGVLFYRGVELLGGDDANLGRARGLLERVAQAYRSTGNLDILPVSLGFWSEAERRLGNAELARKLAEEAAALLDQGAPSLLNEAPVYLALHDACVDVGDLAGARRAIEHGLPHLVRRLGGLTDTPYAHAFLKGLAHNAGLISAAEAYGLVPEEAQRVLGTAAG